MQNLTFSTTCFRCYSNFWQRSTSHIVYLSI